MVRRTPVHRIRRSVPVVLGLVLMLGGLHVAKPTAAAADPNPYTFTAVPGLPYSATGFTIPAADEALSTMLSYDGYSGGPHLRSLDSVNSRGLGNSAEDLSEDGTTVVGGYYDVYGDPPAPPYIEVLRGFDPVTYEGGDSTRFDAPPGSHPQGVRASGDGGRAVYTDGYDGSVGMVDTHTGQYWQVVGPCTGSATDDKRQLELNGDGTVLAVLMDKTCPTATDPASTQLRVYDVTTPDHPRVLSSTPLPEGINPESCWTSHGPAGYSETFPNTAIQTLFDLSTDGRWVAVRTYDADTGLTDVTVHSLTGAADRHVYSTPLGLCDLALSADGGTLAVQLSDKADYTSAVWLKPTTAGATAERVSISDTAGANATARNSQLVAVAGDGNGVLMWQETCASPPCSYQAYPYWNSQLFIAAKPRAAPAWPAGAALSVTDVGETFATLAWPAASGTVADYQITGGPTPVDVDSHTQTTTITGLAPGTTYHFAVVAKNATASSPELTKDVTTDSAAAPGTAALTATVTDADTVALRWDPATVAGLSGYQILRGNGTATPTEVARVSAATTAWTDTTTDGAARYTYRVAALVGSDARPHTKDATVTTAPVAVTSVVGTPVPVGGAAVAASTADVRVRVTGQPHRTVTASLDLVGATDTDHALAETGPGVYTGSIPIPVGATRISGITAKAADSVGSGTGHVATISHSIDWPVSGTLVVKATSSNYQGSWVVSSAATGWSMTGPAAVTGDFATRVAVPAATDLAIRFVRDADQKVTPGPQQLSVGLGQIVEAPSTALALRAALTVHGGSAAAQQHFEVVSDGVGQEVQLDDNGDASVPGLDAGARVTVDPAPEESWRYSSSSQATAVLTAGANSLDLPVSVRAAASLHGTLVLGAVPLDHAAVSVVQTHGRTSVSLDVSAGADGTFTVDGLLAGLPTTVSVTDRRGGTDAAVPVTIGAGANTFSAPLYPAVTYTVTPVLKTESSGGAVTTQPLDWRAAVHFRARLDGPDGSRDSYDFHEGEPFEVVGNKGQAVTFCADGGEGGYGAGCTTKPLPDPATSTAVEVPLTISQIGRTTVHFGLAWKSPPADPRQQVEVVASGARGGVSLTTGAGAGQLSVPSGTYTVYVVEPGTSQVLAELSPRSLTGDSIDLGTMQLAADGTFGGPGNQVGFAQPAAAAGGDLDVRASWAPKTATPAGTVVFTIPDGTSVTDPEKSATVNGKPVTAAVSGANVSVPIPAVAAGGRGSATLHLQVGGNATPGVLAVRADIGGRPVGVGLIDLAEVTLMAPSRVARRSVSVYGRAAPGASVEIADGAATLGKAVAGDSGAWEATVSLGAARAHSLIARTADATSAAVPVEYDQFAPDITGVTISQDGARTVTQPPGAAYPYVVVPKQPMTVAVALADPDRLASADVVLDGVHHPLTRSGAKWTATFDPGFPKGAIDIEYVEAPAPTDVPASTLAGPRPTISQYVGTLTPAFAKAIGTPTTDTSDPKKAKVSIPVGSDPHGIDVTWTISDAPAFDTSTAKQIAPGWWQYGKPSIQPAAGGGGTVKVSMIVDNAVSARSGTAARGSMSRAAAAAPASDSLKLLEVVINADANATALNDSIGTGGKYDKLTDLLKQAAADCNQSNFNYHKSVLDGLLTQNVLADTVSAGAAIAGLALAPETLGLSLGLFVAGYVAARIVDSAIDDDIAAEAAAIQSDPGCKRKPDSPAPPAPGSGGGNGAHPTWIYDPSGTILDGLDPVAGATVTLLRSDTRAGPYTVWDAAAFEQDNNQVTGTDGHYGWNVPPGWYVVSSTAPGRIPAKSAPMQVLPPRTGIDLVLAPEQLPGVVSARAKGTTITVTFDEPMRAAFLTTQQIGVTTTKGAALAVTVRPVTPKAGPDGTLLTKKVAVVVPVKTGRPVELTVGRAVQDLLGRPMSGDVTETLTVAPRPSSACVAAQAAAAHAAAVLASAKAAVAKAHHALVKAKERLKKAHRHSAVKRAKHKVEVAKRHLRGAKSALRTATARAAAAAAIAARACR